MTAHQNTEWDYDTLQEGIAVLEARAREERRLGDHAPAGEKEGHYAAWRAIRHTISFIEWNITEGEILSPLQSYLTQK